MNARNASTPSSRDELVRNVLLGGSVLVLIGAALLVSELWPEVGRYVELSVGIGLLALFVVSRNYPALVGGAIMTGLGAGSLASYLPANDAQLAAYRALGLGLGFVGIWVVGRLMNLPRHHFWPLIPGGILIAVGIGLYSGLLDSDTVWEYIVPGTLVALGLLVVLAGPLRGTNSSRNELVGGSVLVLIGAAWAALMLWPEVVMDVWVLGVGICLLALAAVARSYPTLVAGALMTGFAAGAKWMPQDEVVDVGIALGVGLAFAGVWVVSRLLKLPHHHWWPLVPAGILVVLGFGMRLELLESHMVWYYIVPGVVVVLGLLVILAGYLRLTGRHGGAAA